MPQTPILALPFPSESDPADVPTDIQELAARVEAVRGAPDGLASLDASGQLPATQRPPVAMVTALPASPADGTEVILCDSVSGPAYAWRLRWNATDARWQFVGGTSYRATVATSETMTTVGAWTNLATIGPRLTIPRAGDYLVRFGATLIDSAAESQANLGIGIGDFASPALVEARGHISAANYHLSVSTEAVVTGLAAGAELRVKYLHQIASTYTALQRWLAIQPTRLL